MVTRQFTQTLFTPLTTYDQKDLAGTHDCCTGKPDTSLIESAPNYIQVRNCTYTQTAVISIRWILTSPTTPRPRILSNIPVKHEWYFRKKVATTKLSSNTWNTVDLPVALAQLNRRQAQVLHANTVPPLELKKEEKVERVIDIIKCKLSPLAIFVQF